MSDKAFIQPDSTEPMFRLDPDEGEIAAAIAEGWTVVDDVPADWRSVAYSFVDGAFVANRGVQDGVLGGRLDHAREPLQAELLTAGDAKKVAYALKAMEVADWHRLGSNSSECAAAFDALSPTQQNARFRFALAESAITGETLDVVIARFHDGAAASLGPIATLEALTVVAKRGVSAAGDVTGATTVVDDALAAMEALA